jgi:hypothetical protein
LCARVFLACVDYTSIWFEGQLATNTCYERKTLKPRYPASGSRRHWSVSATHRFLRRGEISTVKPSRRMRVAIPRAESNQSTICRRCLAVSASKIFCASGFSFNDMRRSAGTVGSRDSRSIRSVTLTSSPALARAAFRSAVLGCTRYRRPASKSPAPVVHSRSENWNIFRAQRIAFLARTSATSRTCARTASRELLRQRTHHFVGTSTCRIIDNL